MNLDSKSSAKDIFLKAIDIESPEERAAFLCEACSNDSSLRSRVDALIVAHERPESLLNKPAPEVICNSLPPTTGVAEREKPGSQIGSYKIREQIGEGGMGVVYVAEQEKPLRRKVALKVIKPGMDSKAVLARFDAERNALALMNHPNIARVLDAGKTKHGHPYFAMELVNGIPITEYCDEHRLSIDQRLKLFALVCQAIQHAHQKGVIHRDIKPSNVLVTELDGKPIPKVIDFGVAKALNQSLTDRSIYTSFQSVIGTPLYMSPEQANLSAADVDTRSDVYSLGVLLYELLTGTTPFEHSKLEKAAQHEVLRIIREEEPPRPSNRISTLGKTRTRISQVRQTQPERLGRLVKGDLDWIVMTALEKERSRRYKTADALADDIRRYLASEAITARPPSSSYRLRKFATRNRAAVIASVMIVAAGIFALVAIGWFAWHENQTRRELESNRAVLQSALFRDVFHRALLNGGIDDATFDGPAGLLTDDQKESLRGLDAFYDGRHQKAISHFERGVSAPATFAVKTWCHIACGDYGGAVASIKKMRELSATTAEDHLMIAQLYSWLRPEEALEHLRAAEKSSDPGTIGKLVRALANANLALRTNDLSLIENSIETYEALRVLHRGSEFVREQILFVYCAAALVHERLGNLEQAKQYFERGIDDAERYHAETGHYSTFHPLLLAHQGRYDQSLNLYEELLVDDGHEASFYVATACLANQQKRALKFLRERDSTNIYVKIGMAQLYADDSSTRDKVRPIVDDLLRDNVHSDAEVWAIETLLMARLDEQEVAQLAREIMPKTAELIWKNEVLELMGRLDVASESELDRVKNHSLRMMMRHEAGLRLYARGDFERAEKYFRETHIHSESHHISLWSKYLAKRSRQLASSNSRSQ